MTSDPTLSTIPATSRPITRGYYVVGFSLAIHDIIIILLAYGELLKKHSDFPIDWVQTNCMDFDADLPCMIKCVNYIMTLNILNEI